MKKVFNNSRGFSLVELVLIIALVGLAGFIGWYVWRANHNNSTVETGWTTYTNAELGFQFKYPDEWGTVAVEHRALTSAEREPVLPYFITFSNTDAPTGIIFPTDWSYTPPADVGEWDAPLSRTGLQNDTDAIIIAQNDSSIASVDFSGFSGEITLYGIKSVALTKINATQVELRRSDSYEEKASCLQSKENIYGSIIDYPTLSCYTETYRENFVESLSGFEAY